MIGFFQLGLLEGSAESCLFFRQRIVLLGWIHGKRLGELSCGHIHRRTYIVVDY